MLTDIEIAQKSIMKPIEHIAYNLNIYDYESYGRYKAKLKYNKFGDKKGKLVLVTAMNPTPMGEGKTTISIGLADGLRKIDQDSILCLREPSLGPIFGVKGGAAGGGYSQVIPMEDINLHFTGDIHAIESANNLLAAMIDNHIYHGNELDIQTITWRRCMDMNDRQLRVITSGLGSETDGRPRADGFDITVASEVMAIFCLSSTLEELEENLANIIVGYNSQKQPVFAGQLHAEGAMTALLKDAFNPNLVQTLEHTPALIHGGPFANIAHGCNSIAATKLGLTLADWVVTEAGFGADLGAEKFLDIKCPRADIAPNIIVVVATTKAIKYNGGVSKDKVKEPNREAMKKGIVNLLHHVEAMEKYGVPVIVAINKYDTDTDEELKFIQDNCGVPAAICTSHANGGMGAVSLAELVTTYAKEDIELKHPYNLNESDIKHKVEALACDFYGADQVVWSSQAALAMRDIERLGGGHYPICVAKTQYSISDNPLLLGEPRHFPIEVKDLILCTGAGFIVAICGKIMRMPGLPKHPAAENIDVVDGKIIGLF